MMGTPRGEPFGRSEERPVREVCISRPFVVKQTEVTQAEWEELMGNNPSYFGHCGADCPVERVSWWDALAFCNKLSALSGLEQCYELVEPKKANPGQLEFSAKQVRFKGLDCEGFRLPTEAEWEYASRSGTDGPTYDGELSAKNCEPDPNLERLAWYCGNSEVGYEGCRNLREAARKSKWARYLKLASECAGTHPVAQKLPNPWGLYDVLGNVAEWCWDYRHSSYEGMVQRDPANAKYSERRVARGGAWHLEGGRARTAARRGVKPVRRKGGWYYSAMGLRPVRTVK